MVGQHYISAVRKKNNKDPPPSSGSKTFLSSPYSERRGRMRRKADAAVLAVGLFAGLFTEVGAPFSGVFAVRCWTTRRNAVADDGKRLLSAA
jgi:hypothetical protein